MKSSRSLCLKSLCTTSSPLIHRLEPASELRNSLRAAGRWGRVRAASACWRHQPRGCLRHPPHAARCSRECTACGRQHPSWGPSFSTPTPEGHSLVSAVGGHVQPALVQHRNALAVCSGAASSGARHGQLPARRSSTGRRAVLHQYTPRQRTSTVPHPSPALPLGTSPTAAHMCCRCSSSRRSSRPASCGTQSLRPPPPLSGRGRPAATDTKRWEGRAGEAAAASALLPCTRMIGVSGRFRAHPYPIKTAGGVRRHPHPLAAAVRAQVWRGRH